MCVYHNLHTTPVKCGAAHPKANVLIFVVKLSGVNKASVHSLGGTVNVLRTNFQFSELFGFGMTDKELQTGKNKQAQLTQLDLKVRPWAFRAHSLMCELALGLRMAVRSKATPRLAPSLAPA